MTMTEYACKFIGKSYIWGGDNARGFDCSGLIIEILQAFDVLPKGDWTADALSKTLLKYGYEKVSDYRENDVVFFGTSKYTHVAMMINDNQYIEAGGGNSKSTTYTNSTGMIRLRPISWRKPTLILRRNK